MNRLSNERRAGVLTCLNEGVSIRSAVRITGAAKDTILRLLAEAGEFCRIYQDYRLRNLSCERIEADEIWSFVGAKHRNARSAGQGDIWTFTAIDVDTRLMASWFLGDRSLESACAFMEDLASRVTGRIQLTTDGWQGYPESVRRAFGYRIDYSQLVKNFGLDPELPQKERRYSPTTCIGSRNDWVIGDPDMDRVSTSIVERANLGIRTSMRRYTRLTNSHSKKAKNHVHAFNVYTMVYNFCRPHGALTTERGGRKTNASDGGEPRGAAVDDAGDGGADGLGEGAPEEL